MQKSIFAGSLRFKEKNYGNTEVGKFPYKLHHDLGTAEVELIFYLNQFQAITDVDVTSKKSVEKKRKNYLFLMP